jgi:hypothetical protein
VSRNITVMAVKGLKLKSKVGIYKLCSKNIHAPFPKIIRDIIKREFYVCN